jgi:hypothetical protein
MRHSGTQANGRRGEKPKADFPADDGGLPEDVFVLPALVGAAVDVGDGEHAESLVGGNFEQGGQTFAACRGSEAVGCFGDAEFSAGLWRG